MAEEMEKGLKAYGHPVMRVRIDPKTFPIWCAAHGARRAGRAAGPRRRGGEGALRREDVKRLSYFAAIHALHNTARSP